VEDFIKSRTIKNATDKPSWFWDWFAPIEESVHNYWTRETVRILPNDLKLKEIDNIESFIWNLDEKTLKSPIDDYVLDDMIDKFDIWKRPNFENIEEALYVIREAFGVDKSKRLLNWKW
jgi:hypothetical protein